jgi:hypothetical protein
MAQTKEQTSLAAKRARAWKLYRVTLEEQGAVDEYMRNNKDYSILLERGNPKDKTPALVFTDHDHTTGLVRGRLAYLINKALGILESSYKERTAEVLDSLSKYLMEPPALYAIGAKYGMIGKAKLNKKKIVYGPPVKKGTS